MNIYGKIIKLTKNSIIINISRHKNLKLYKKNLILTKNIKYLNYRLEFKIGDFVYINTEPIIKIKIIK